MKTKPIIFNRKNLLNFANRIYSNNGNTVSYTKLCQGRLKAGNFSCIIGEAFNIFVGSELLHKQSTNSAIKALVSSAKLNVFEQHKLYIALSNLVTLNDSGGPADCSPEKRAQLVSDELKSKVAPLLKSK